jgi:uncharacterized protein YhbP (UPF0306 family)
MTENPDKQDSRKLTRHYLEQIKIMQLATSINDQPWACTVHFYADEGLNFYWVSRTDRKHSQHIAQNPKVAAAVLVHENTSAEPYVIGISIAGTAELVSEQLSEQISQSYIDKLSKDPNLLTDIATTKNLNKFYRLKPTSIVLLDSKNFPDNPRQEYSLSA